MDETVARRLAPLESGEVARRLAPLESGDLLRGAAGTRSARVYDEKGQPLAAFDGKTGTEVAEEAYAMHVTQRSAGMKIRGKRYIFSVRETGGLLFPNTVFGLCRTEVGPDEMRNDFLEHIPEN